MLKANDIRKKSRKACKTGVISTCHVLYLLLFLWNSRISKTKASTIIKIGSLSFDLETMIISTPRNPYHANALSPNRSTGACTCAPEFTVSQKPKTPTNIKNCMNSYNFCSSSVQHDVIFLLTLLLVVLQMIINPSNTLLCRPLSALPVKRPW